jgi:hypothetical protein
MSATLGWCKTAQANTNSSDHKSNVMPTTFRGLIELVSLNVRCALMQPNDPKLSHGAENRKRGFANKRKIKEQPPLAPARC